MSKNKKDDVSINVDILSKERQKEVLKKVKIELVKNNSVWYRFRYFNILHSRDLLKCIIKLNNISEKDAHYVPLEKILTIPFMGLTKEELYTMGLDKEKIDKYWKENQDDVTLFNQILGENGYETVFPWRKEQKKCQLLRICILKHFED